MLVVVELLVLVLIVDLVLVVVMVLIVVIVVESRLFSSGGLDGGHSSSSIEVAIVERL